MFRKIARGLAFLGLAVPTTLLAVPVLQVGAPASGSTCGPYATYVASSTNPTEEDTAFTSGNTICVGGVYQNNNVLNLGGQFGSGNDWGTADSDLTSWNGRDAVLIAAVPNGSLAAAAGLTVGGNSFFGTSLTNFFFPNNHDPLKDDVSDFLFFDIGNFADNPNAVPDFATNAGSADGQVMALALAGQGSLSWIHFDVMALETSQQGGGANVRIVTTIANNPGSHDLTWKPNGGPPVGELPEPSVLWLLGLSLVAFGFVQRRRTHR